MPKLENAHILLNVIIVEKHWTCLLLLDKASKPQVVFFSCIRQYGAATFVNVSHVYPVDSRENDR